MTTPAEPKPAYVPTRRDKVLGTALGLAAVTALAAWSFWPSGTEAADGYDAQVACKDFVRDRLKSPSAADFSGLSHSGSGNTWTVTGTVDAPNSFNAPVRSAFTCKVRIDGDTWHLLSLTGLN